MKADNFFHNIPADLPEELFTTILEARGFRVERIVSQGHASPRGFWYDQEETELVIVLEGSAVVQFEGAAEPVELERGSYLTIPAHAKHRVVRTHREQKTVWLAIHYGASALT